MFARVNCGLLSKAVKTKWAELLTHVQEAAPSSTRGHGCFPSTAGLHLQIMCNLYQKIFVRTLRAGGTTPQEMMRWFPKEKIVSGSSLAGLRQEFIVSSLHGVRTFIFTHALLAYYFASFSALSHSGRCQQAVQESSRAYDVCLFSVTIKKRQS